MPTISEQFHAIANFHNKISIPVGCAREFLKAMPLDTLTKDQLKAKQEEIVVLFDKVEKNVLDAAQIMTSLKEFIYKKIDKNTELG